MNICTLCVFLSSLQYLTGSTEWIRNLRLSPGHQYLFEVPVSFLEDPVTANAVLHDIGQHAPPKEETQITSSVVESAVLLLRGKIRNVHAHTETETAEIEEMARKIYGLYHARYCVSNAGLKSVKGIFEKGGYGRCQRVCCDAFPLLPVGLDDDPGLATTKCFCAKCRELYEPPQEELNLLDGSNFGSSLPHLFFHRYLKLAPTRSNVTYVPRIFGFKLHHTAAEIIKYNRIEGDLTEL